MLRKEGKIDYPQFKALISGIAAFVVNAKIVQPQKRLLICRDAKDNILLECCLSAESDYLITGDSDLLDIADLPFKLKILSPRKFIEDV